MNGPVAALAESFPEAEYGERHGDHVVRVERGRLAEFAAAAKEAGFEMFVDLCAVDYLRRPEGRFEIVVNLVSITEPQRIRILSALPGSDPSAPSLTGVYPGANFYEREAYDLFGIDFEGHPDLTRILLPDEWAGHPLRKDAPVGSVPVQFKHPDEDTT
jgi:NADH-quinone oxidoreductase subunit C